MKMIAKIRYTDFQKRSHFVEVESDASDNASDRRHIEELVKTRYPAEKVYIQSVRQK